MKGFSDHALILLPDWEDYLNMSFTTKSILDQSMNNIFKYAYRCGMEVHCLTNDVLATQLFWKCNEATPYAPKLEDVIWKAGFCPEDLVFARNNIADMERANPPDMDMGNEDLFVQARKLHPTKRGSSLDERFEVILNRGKFLAAKAIVDSKFVITFENRNKENFKVKEGEAADGRMIWRISSSNNYRLLAILSGSITNLKPFIPYDKLYEPVYKWNVKKLVEVS